MTISFDPSMRPLPSLDSGRLGSLESGQSAPAGADFAKELKSFVGEVNDYQKIAEVKSDNFATGKSNDIHGTMIAVEQAEISLRLLGNVRNRMVEMYREVMRMGS